MFWGWGLGGGGGRGGGWWFTILKEVLFERKCCLDSDKYSKISNTISYFFCLNYAFYAVVY